jgi:hypothetical protein
MSIAEMAYQETQTEEGKRRAEHERVLVAAKQVVNDTAMAWFRGKPDLWPDNVDLYNACAALAKLEKE